MPTWKNSLRLVKLTVFVRNYIVQITENAIDTPIKFFKSPEEISFRPLPGFSEVV